MKLIYTVLVLVGVIQLVLAVSGASPSSSSMLNKTQLVQFYAKEINALSRQTCVQFYIMSIHILRDPIIQQAKTPLIQEFKRNITQFQEIYPIYIRYGLNKQLLMIFSHTTINYYYWEPIANKDSRYILKLIRKLGYDQIFDQFESSFVDFALKKFVPKIEEFKKQIRSNEMTQWQKFFEWAEEMKACSVYSCFYHSFNRFDKIILTPREQLLAYVRFQLREIDIFYANSSIQIIEGVLKNKQILQLRPTVRRILVQTLNDYIRIYNSNNDTNALYSLQAIFYKNVLIQFYDNNQIPAKDRQILKNIFDEQGYVQFKRNYYKKLKDFVELGLFERFENFRVSLNEEELLKEKPLLDWLDTFKRLTSYQEKAAALKELIATERV